jgi:succinate dehydrogenase / fumarate reductase cytochrome b subunit
MVAWAFHRLSGIGIWAFVVLHVFDIYLVGGDPKLYDELLAFYASVPGRLLEVLLGAALLYHALNGLRIIIIDLWPRMAHYHRQIWWASWVIFVAVGVPGAFIILRPLFFPTGAGA